MIALDSFSGVAYLKTVEKIPGVALLAHGLNMKPSKMDALARFFASEGFEVFRAVLSGHEGDLEAMKSATRARWKSEALGFYKEARKRAQAQNAPLYLVGFSFGALIFEELMNSDEAIAFERAVLLAPAVSLRASSQIMRASRILSPRTMIFSLGPPQYRAHWRGTSVAAYDVLFKTMDSLHARRFCASNVPTLVFIDPGDELVSYKGLLRAREKYGLSQWKIVAVSNKGSALRYRLHHIIADEEAVGSQQWDEMKNQMKLFLNL